MLKPGYSYIVFRAAIVLTVLLLFPTIYVFMDREDCEEGVGSSLVSRLEEVGPGQQEGGSPKHS